MFLVLLLCLLWFSHVLLTKCREEVLHFPPFGSVPVYSATIHPSQIILLVSGEEGWNQEARSIARALAATEAIIVGIDLPQYLHTLSGTEESCSYPGGDFAALSKFVQQQFAFPQYVHPVLVGVAAGATFVYATVAQAPPDMFQGVMSLGFCPELIVKKPLCEWNSLKWYSHPSAPRFRLMPGAELPAPWIVLQGEDDHVCSTTTIEAFTAQVAHSSFLPIPQVGHHFADSWAWLPQFHQAFARLSKSVSPLITAEALADLPLVEIPARNSTTGTDALAVILSGDGGWASIDREIGDAFVQHGVSVIGLNSLKYFWTRRTPDGAAKDLERILRSYLMVWKKDKALLVGYSLGADVLPFMANRLPLELRSHIPLVALLGPAHTVDFEFHLTDWTPGAASAGKYVILPEVQKLSPGKVLCFYGEQEGETLCPDLDPQRVQVIRMKGGHHFDANYQDVAMTILREAHVMAQ